MEPPLLAQKAREKWGTRVFCDAAGTDAGGLTFLISYFLLTVGAAAFGAEACGSRHETGFLVSAGAEVAVCGGSDE